MKLSLPMKNTSMSIFQEIYSEKTKSKALKIQLRDKIYREL